MLDHKHLIINCRVNKPPVSPAKAKQWAKTLIDDIDMEIFIGPHAAYCHDEGNRGLTISAIISTSHFCAHFWDEDNPGHARIDLYSCKDFDIDVVFRSLEQFKPTELSYVFLDRNGNKIKKVNDTMKTINNMINKIWGK